MKSLIRIIIFLVTAISLSIAANTKQPLDLIIVQGTAYVEALPDTAYFNLTIAIEKDTPEIAARIGEKVRLNIKEILTLNGIINKDIIQDATRINEHWNYKAKKKIHIFNYSLIFKLKDFSSPNNIRKQLINERTFAPVKGSWANRNGLRVNQFINYAIVENKNELEIEAIKKAYHNALAKVKGIAKISKLKYEIHEISANQYKQNNFRQKSYSAQASAMNEGISNSPLINTKDTIPTLERINATVTIKAKILSQ